MDRRRASDWLLTGSVCGGLFMPLLLGGVFAAAALRGQLGYPRWRAHHGLMLCASLWGLLALSSRGFQEEGLAYLAYLWIIPLLMAFYKPDRGTSETYQQMILAIFVADLSFNAYALLAGSDLLGRQLDQREGLLSSMRAGGLFAHSFYSGSISIAALILFITRRSSSAFIALALFNLLAAGAWRLSIAALTVLLMSQLWDRLGRRGYFTFIAIASILVAVAVILTSGLLDTSFEVNESNTNRVFAWLLAMQKISDAWLLGVGLPMTSELTSVNTDAIDNYLIAESWYLSTSLAFGVPYTIFMLSALLISFFGRNFKLRDRRFSLLMSLVFVDMVAGEFFQGVLIYTWMWVLIGEADTRQRTAGQTL